MMMASQVQYETGQNLRDFSCGCIRGILVSRSLRCCLTGVSLAAIDFRFPSIFLVSNFVSVLVLWQVSRVV